MGSYINNKKKYQGQIEEVENDAMRWNEGTILWPAAYLCPCSPSRKNSGGPSTPSHRNSIVDHEGDERRFSSFSGHFVVASGSRIDYVWSRITPGK
jgi:hypothetical protein